MSSQFASWLSSLQTYKLELLYVILGLSAITLIFILRRKREGGYLDNPLHTINWITIIINALAQLSYLYALGDNATWFCSPSQVGWLWSILNFLLFSSVVYIQIKAFLETLEDFNYNHGGDVKWKLGLYAWPAAAVLYIASSYLLAELVYLVFIALLIVQTIQVIRIFKEISYYDGWGYALLVAVFYLILSATTLWLVVHFIPLLVVALLAFVVLYILSSGSDKTTSSSESDNRYSIKRCPSCNGELNVCRCKSEIFYREQKWEEERKVKREIERAIEEQRLNSKD